MNEMSITKSVSMFGLATIARSMTSLIMLPVYMRYLTPEDYGIIELLGMMLDITIIIIGSKLVPALIRFYAIAESDKERSQIIYGSITVGSGLNMVGVGVLLIFAPSLSEWMFGNQEYVDFIRLYSVTLLTTIVTEIGLGTLRAKEEPGIYLAISLVKLGIQVSLNLLLLIHLDMGVEGVIWSALLSGIVVTVILVIYLLFHHRPSLSLPGMVSLVVFSLPITVATLADFYVVFGDRYFLQMFSGLTEVGLYAVAYKFGFILVTLSWGPFAQAWEPKAYKAAKNGAPPSFFHNYFLISIMFVGICATGIALFSKEILQIIATEKFYSAAQIIPPIVLAYTIKCFGEFGKLGFMVKGKTMHQFYAMFFAAIIATIGFLTLIPKYGAAGAAWTTVISISGKSLWECLAGRKYLDMELPWGPILNLAILATLAVLIGEFWLPDTGLIQSIAAKLVLFLGFLTTAWFLTGLPHSTKTVIITATQPLVLFLKRPRA